MVLRLKTFFNSQNSVRGASILLIITLATSNVLGLLRDHFLASYIPTHQLDIYFASFRIPDLIFNFLILGAISSAFIPVFCGFVASKKLDEGWKVVSSLINLAVILLIALAVLLFFLMPYLTPLVVPNFDPERMAQTTALSRLLMITPIIFCVSYIFSGILNSFKRFAAYAVAPLVYNLSIIIGAVFAAPSWGINGVVYFVIAGAFFHMMVQLFPVINLGFGHKFVFDYKNSAIKKIIRLMIPRTIGMGMNQILLITYTAIASALATGSITAFNFANNIQTMPIVVFGTSFATAVFPTLTTAIAHKDEKKFVFYLNRSIRSIAFLLIPITAAFILLRAQIVRLILGSGHFAWSDTKATALTLGYFSISLFAQGLIPLLARSFYAKKDTKTPMYISIATVIISITISYPLVSKLGVAGLALAFSLGSYFNATALYLFLSWKVKNVFDKKMVISIVKITLISLISAFVIWGLMHYLAVKVNMNTFVGVLEQTIISLAAGVLVYFSLARLFSCEEISWAITRKLNGKKIACSEQEAKSDNIEAI